MSELLGSAAKTLVTTVLYTALILGANADAVRAETAPAETSRADISAADIAALREGDMKKLNVHAEPEPVSDQPFTTGQGGEARLTDYAGKVVLVNFWATWCAPCRKEMPMLAELQQEFGGEAFEVVTIAVGRNARPGMEKFFDEIGVDNLPLHIDRPMTLSRAMGVLGLPVTLLVDRDGNEVARLQGDAVWNSDSAKAIIRAMIAGDTSG